jgi:hypothetical protein
MTSHSVVVELARLVEDLRRDRELADVVQEQAERDLRQAALDAVEAPAAGEVDPAVVVERAAGEHGAQGGDVHDVLEEVLVGAHHVREVQRDVGHVLHLVGDDARDVGELAQRVVGQALALGHRGLGLGERGADRVGGLAAGLVGDGGDGRMPSPSSSSTQTVVMPLSASARL